MGSGMEASGAQGAARRRVRMWGSERGGMQVSGAVTVAVRRAESAHASLCARDALLEPSSPRETPATVPARVTMVTQIQIGLCSKAPSPRTDGSPGSSQTFREKDTEPARNAGQQRTEHRC
ncbi:hypothetical protein AAFF_G00130100 [Aldrovandia affinis]|uniref:Uncharacterized protein n=1 Tax=Aldrovandia affinis TaxID=143900 RepID=A0AAD7RRA7_9TELE|nr:hypothetical protein AAFF_G00130100 [Aldrovandia affinis]